jgi:hypothetical protein
LAIAVMVITGPLNTNAYAPAAAVDSGASHAYKDGGSFTFHDILDTLNPLQHLPIIGPIYRWLTGDEPGNVARIIGDGLFGGPVGFASGLISVAVKEQTGKDPGALVIAALTGGDAGAAATAAAPPPASADSKPPLATPAAAAAPRSQPLLQLAKAPLPAPGSTASSPAEQAFLAQSSAFQRTAGSQRGAAGGRNFTQPVPLQLSGQALPGAVVRPVAALPNTSAAPPASETVPAPALPQNPPADISQRMLEALDKYARIRQERGQVLDLSP